MLSVCNIMKEIVSSQAPLPYWELYYVGICDRWEGSQTRRGSLTTYSKCVCVKDSRNCYVLRNT